MLQDSVRVTSAWRKHDGNDFRNATGVNDMSPDQLLVDSSFTTVAFCQEPPSLADLMRPNSTTSFLI